ncbi:MAG TPA: hypothetical protein ENO03_05755 [Candidatus Aminicenantes bacterium]|nr:hypothetical protein [Candidatus Aminicenantes bacterium]HDT13848.1 hypothetical protein [Candidatus Aminicenantes bacterium]
MNTRLFVLAAALTVPLLPMRSAGREAPPHYDLTLVLQPAEKRIQVTGTIRLTDVRGSGAFTLYLHKGLSFRTFEIDGIPVDPGPAGPSDIQFMPAAFKYDVSSPPQAEGFAERILGFSYDGALDERPEWLANIVSETWVEIGNYFPWYPVCPGLGPFTYKVTVSAPSPYRVYAPGTETRTGGRFVFESNRPTKDVVVCASADLRVQRFRVDGNDFSLASFSLDSETIRALVRDVDDVYRTLGRWYGRIEQPLALVESKREKGGGYSRPGGLFLPGFTRTPYLDNRLGYRRYLAHEIAHGWWNLADASTWHDWLNESFAEYTALRYLRETAGTGEFRKRIESYARESEGLPPLWELDRDSEAAYEALYRKGPVLLHRLEERLGTDRFISLCRTVLEQRAGRTEDFFVILKAAAGEETAFWFENLLRTL